MESVCNKVANKPAVDCGINKEINNLDVKSPPAANRRFKKEANGISPTKDNKQSNADKHKQASKKVHFLGNTIVTMTRSL